MGKINQEIKLRVVKQYTDVVLEKKLKPGFEMVVDRERAIALSRLGLVEILEIVNIKK